jgi:hypothetical protein
MGVYGLIGLVTTYASTSDMQTLVSRLIMMAAVAVIGNQYLRMERNRRQAATEARQNLMKQVRESHQNEPSSSPVAG